MQAKEKKKKKKEKKREKKTMVDSDAAAMVQRRKKKKKKRIRKIVRATHSTTDNVDYQHNRHTYTYHNTYAALVSLDEKNQ